MELKKGLGTKLFPPAIQKWGKVQMEGFFFFFFLDGGFFELGKALQGLAWLQLLLFFLILISRGIRAGQERE